MYGDVEFLQEGSRSNVLGEGGEEEKDDETDRVGNRRNSLYFPLESF